MVASHLFSPAYPNDHEDQGAIEAVIHQRLENFGLDQTRWTLKAILTACNGLYLKTLSGVYQVLQRLKIHLKRGRAHLHSPDPDYIGKLHQFWLWIQNVHLNPEKQVLLFSDEFTFYRQPSLSVDYERAGLKQPLAELGYRTNLTWRIAGALNAWTGQLTYATHSHFTLKLLVDFYQQVAQDYPQAETILLVLDNWPVHFHADVLAAFRYQPPQWPRKMPAHWTQTPSAKVRRLDLPICLLSLPTYDPWNNPIEKLWRLLKQQVLHLHRFVDDWDGLKLRVNQKQDSFLQPSPDLLRYIGLQNPLSLYHSLFREV